MKEYFVEIKIIAEVHKTIIKKEEYETIEEAIFNKFSIMNPWQGVSMWPGGIKPELIDVRPL